MGPSADGRWKNVLLQTSQRLSAAPGGFCCGLFSNRFLSCRSRNSESPHELTFGFSPYGDADCFQSSSPRLQVVTFSGS